MTFRSTSCPWHRCSRRYALIAIAVALIASGGVSEAGAEVGRPAPSLVASDLNGQTFDLSALRGKVVVVNFWATWCPPCREEMPALNAFYERYHSKGLEMIGLSTDRARDEFAVDGDDLPSFNLLQNFGGAEHTILFYAFDLLILARRTTSPLRLRLPHPDDGRTHATFKRKLNRRMDMTGVTIRRNGAC